jgi:hypothetical protein
MLFPCSLAPLSPADGHGSDRTLPAVPGLGHVHRNTVTVSPPPGCITCAVFDAVWRQTAGYLDVVDVWASVGGMDSENIIGAGKVVVFAHFQHDEDVLRQAL